jgi:hypothetical protein
MYGLLKLFMAYIRAKAAGGHFSENKLENFEACDVKISWEYFSGYSQCSRF